MKNGSAIWLTSAFYICTLCFAEAQPRLNAKVIPPQVSEALKGGNLYLLTIRCKPIGQLRNLNTEIIGFAGIRRDINVSHTVLVSKTLPPLSADPDKAKVGAVDLPKDPIAVVPAYTKQGTVGYGIDYRKTCTQSIILDGAEPYHLVAIETNSSTHRPGVLLSFLFTLPNLVPPVWSLLFNAKISQSVKDKLDATTTVKTPLQEAMESLNTAYNYVDGSALTTGKFRITTRFSEITVEVERVPSVVKAGHGESIKKLVRNGNSPFKSDSEVSQTCSDIAADLKLVGYSENEDIPFALAHAANRAPSNKDRILTCLGKAYALRAANLGLPLWGGIIEERQVTDRDAVARFPVDQPTYPTQPNDRFIGTKISEMISAFARIGKNVARASDISKLRQMSHSLVTFEDRTDSARFAGLDAGSLDKIAEFLKNKGILRFGCFKPTDYGRYEDGAITSLLIFESNYEDRTVPLSKTFVLRPLFEDSKISKIYVYDEGGWEQDIFFSFENACNTLALEPVDRKKPIATPPATPKPEQAGTSQSPKAGTQLSLRLINGLQTEKATPRTAISRIP